MKMLFRERSSSMQEENKKEKWGRPVLTVLVRGDRQEGVLWVCKGELHTVDPGTEHFGCGWTDTACNICQENLPPS